MSFLFTSQTYSQGVTATPVTNTATTTLVKPDGKNEMKIPVPPVLSAADLKTALGQLSYAIPGHYVSVKKTAKKAGKAQMNKVLWTLEGGLPSMDRPFSNGNQVFNFHQQFEIAGVHTTSVAVETFSAQSWTLSQCNNSATFQALFDQYRIPLIEFWLTPQSKLESAAGQTVGLMTSVIDYDDGTALTSVASAGDYDSAVTGPGGMGHYRKFVPHVAIAAYSGAFTSFANEEAPWIDIASNTVVHYGVKFASTVTSVAYSYGGVVRMHVQCRNTR
jgi:hypothetical protein